MMAASAVVAMRIVVAMMPEGQPVVPADQWMQREPLRGTQAAVELDAVVRRDDSIVATGAERPRLGGAPWKAPAEFATKGKVWVKEFASRFP